MSEKDRKGVDDNQGAFRKATGDISYYEDEEMSFITNLDESGYKASEVNLGALYDKIVAELKGEDVDADEITEIIDANVQRVSYFNIEETKTHWEIRFVTKDDRSYWGYDFTIYKPRLE